MTEGMLQQHVDEVRALAQRARDLFGHNLIEPTDLDVRPEPVAE